MKIAFLPGVFPMLSETPVLNQITGLVARGHEVDIYGDRPKRPDPYHPSIDRLGLLARARYRPDLPPTTLGRWSKARRLYSEAGAEERPVLLRSMNPLRFGTRAATGRLPLQTAQFLPPRRYDIVQGGFGEQGLKALRMIKVGAMQGPLITAFRGADLTRFVRSRGDGVYAELFRRGDLFQPVCEAFARRLREMGCPADRIQVHRTGIEVAKFPYNARRPGRFTRLISIGRLVEKKGLGDALAAVAQVNHAAIRYTVVGDGPLREALERGARELGIADLVEFAGALPQPEVHARLAESDLLLAPSITAADGDQEGIPNVLKEAMALGVLVLSTRHSGIPELVEDGVTGYLVPERDSRALGTALGRILESPETWEPIQTAARAKIEREYDIEKLNDQLVLTYEKVIRS
jgi:colanic acid/amylovoran biosynthesis glycosyltransferase